ncbi:hypothetical protein [Streptomyces virginiae]|uniref:hypothetical protein n=1 Tax=Streptomyces virginiae TaxID=1961 RepID=UPI002253BC8C|nr:hypothetical protein [Streptomyces virginiae]MCX4718729.1 hypothetical protein [Streptomyces virginiae]MCX5276368.1 hypothetical protein [Streptomyces virginiae]
MIDHEEARKAAIASLYPTKAVPDAIVTDRWFLPNYMKALVIEAVKRDAPEGVVEDLMPDLRRMARKAERMDDYGVEVLARLEGLRDEDEIVPVLERARDEAPDEVRRVRIQRVLDRIRKPSLSLEELIDLSDEQLEEILEDPCAHCCIYGCSLCLVTCLICCAGTCYCCEGGC